MVPIFSLPCCQIAFICPGLGSPAGRSAGQSLERPPGPRCPGHLNPASTTLLMSFLRPSRCMSPPPPLLLSQPYTSLQGPVQASGLDEVFPEDS